MFVGRECGIAAKTSDANESSAQVESHPSPCPLPVQGRGNRPAALTRCAGFKVSRLKFEVAELISNMRQQRERRTGDREQRPDVRP